MKNYQIRILSLTELHTVETILDAMGYKLEPPTIWGVDTEELFKEQSFMYIRTYSFDNTYDIFTCRDHDLPMHTLTSTLDWNYSIEENLLLIALGHEPFDEVK